MAGAAVVLALLTVLVGTLVLADLGSGSGGGRWIAGHVASALAGAVILSAGAFVGSRALDGVSVAVLVLAVGCGIVLYRSTRGRTAVSTGILVVHGAAAGLTIAATVLAALRV